MLPRHARTINLVGEHHWFFLGGGVSVGQMGTVSSMRPGSPTRLARKTTDRQCFHSSKTRSLMTLLLLLLLLLWLLWLLLLLLVLGGWVGGWVVVVMLPVVVVVLSVVVMRSETQK